MDLYDLAAVATFAAALTACLRGYRWAADLWDREPVDLDAADMAHRHDDWIPTKYQP